MQCKDKTIVAGTREDAKYGKVLYQEFWGQSIDVLPEVEACVNRGTDTEDFYE